MKKILILTTMFMALATFSFGQTIVGTMHDFNNATGNGSVADTWNSSASNQKCGPCHVPHNAVTASTPPLWAHDETAEAFTMYPATLAGTAQSAGPSGSSLVCLGCHDGVTALDAHVNTVASNATAMTGAANLGTNLAGSHPVSIPYVAANDLFATTTTVAALGGATIAAGMLESGNIECASCHNAHIDTDNSFLIFSNQNSALCLTCHDK